MSIHARRFLISVAVIAAFLWAGEAAAATRKRAGTWNSASLKAKLAQPMTCEFDATPLDEVIEYFRSTLAINIVCDPPPEAEEKLITLRVADVPASSALNWVTKIAGLKYTVAENVVYIASAERIALAGKPYFHQYALHDLLLPTEVLVARRDNDNDSDDDDRNRGRGGAYDAARQLITLVVLFTGGRSSWDYVEIMGYGRYDEDENETESREDNF